MKFYDNTRIKAYKLCPRFYYYRHVRNWTLPAVNSALAFGTGWHAGMDVIWPGVTEFPERSILVGAAASAWRDAMIADGIPIDEPEYALNDFRTEGTAAEMFHNYIIQREQFLSEIEVLECERPFAVPIDKSAEIFYVGRLDKVFRHKGRIHVAEHKTTSMYAKAGNFRSIWMNSFSPNSQIDGYAYACMLIYENFKSVWVDAALTHKQVHDGFKLIPLERSKSAMELWLWETNLWIARVEDDLQGLENFRRSESDKLFLPSFPRSCPDSCVQYNRECIYKDLCISHPNPETISVPEGFVERRWEPFDEFKLERIGLKKED